MHVYIYIYIYIYYVYVYYIIIYSKAQIQHNLECWSAADAFACTQALRAGIFGLLLWLDIQPLAECAADLSDVARIAMLIFIYLFCKQKYPALMPLLYVSSYYCICVLILL